MESTEFDISTTTEAFFELNSTLPFNGTEFTSEKPVSTKEWLIPLVTTLSVACVVGIVFLILIWKCCEKKPSSRSSSALSKISPGADAHKTQTGFKKFFGAKSSQPVDSRPMSQSNFTNNSSRPGTAQHGSEDPVGSQGYPQGVQGPRGANPLPSIESSNSVARQPNEDQAGVYIGGAPRRLVPLERGRLEENGSMSLGPTVPMIKVPLEQRRPLPPLPPLG